MSITPKYFEYLKHFEKTATVQTLAQNPLKSNLIALRHDVDYDLDLALEMSYWEHEWGICSSYYLLHTAEYWQDNRFYEKCLQIQEFGHEIGLHLNLITEWMEGKIDNIASRLQELIQGLREAGVVISGVSPHGDQSCYRHHYINYWCFAELRPDNPFLESHLSAEGIPVNETAFQIQYPPNHKLVRSDGAEFPLWSLQMKDLGLVYEAMHIPYDHYYTDSGGSWKRSDDPRQRSLRKGRHQILIHPLYWRGKAKTYFFLSTARSGSTWLANVLKEATPLVSKHEFTLNHRYQGQELIPEKNTGHGFTQLLASPEKATFLLREIRSWREEFSQDYGEANVYLGHFPELLQQIFPEAVLVHLHRQPTEVARSLMNRDWYDTPEDDQHPIMPISGWEDMAQFEKVCWYIRYTNESLLTLCHQRLKLEKIATDYNCLIKELKQLNIPVFPRLLALEFEKQLNRNYRNEFPSYLNWSWQHKATFYAICDPIAIAIGYRAETPFPTNLTHFLRGSLIKLTQLKKRFLKPFPLKQPSPQLIYQIDFTQTSPLVISHLGCQLTESSEGLTAIPEGNRNAYVLFGGGEWYSLQEGEGFPLQINVYYKCSVNLAMSPQGSARFFCLMYDDQGNLIDKRSLAPVNPKQTTSQFSFRLKSHIHRFNIALYCSVADLPKSVTLKEFELLHIQDN
jgi:hypothetical protein